MAPCMQEFLPRTSLADSNDARKKARRLPTPSVPLQLLSPSILKEECSKVFAHLHTLSSRINEQHLLLSLPFPLPSAKLLPALSVSVS